jgi:diguanylate cyclase (GGDEF)-like protein/PAS domain S-box-containing protein
MNLKNCNILYVEDEELLQDLLKGVLKNKSKNIFLANNGEEGLDLYQKHDIDIVITDIVMPFLDGFEMARKIKDIDRNQYIMVLSALDNLETIKKVIDIGIDDFEAKPIKDIKRMIGKLESCATNILKDKELESVKKELMMKNRIIDKHLLVTLSDLDGNITQASEALLNITGYTKDELIGQNHSILGHNDDQDKAVTDLWDTLQKDQAWRGELENSKKNGEKFWVDIIVEPLYDESGEKKGFIAIKHNITDKKKIEILSITDTLTTLYNRRQFNKSFEMELSKAESRKIPLSLILLDIDFFKYYNDYYGHPKGDEVLKKIGSLLNIISSNNNSYAFRIGGEEFALIVSNIAEDELKDLCEHILNQVASLHIEHKMSKISNILSISIGAVYVDKYEQSFHKDELYTAADELLYKSKNEGRGKYTSRVWGDDTKSKAVPVDMLTKLPIRSMLASTLVESVMEKMLIIINIANFDNIKNNYGPKIADSVLLDRAKKYRKIISGNFSFLYRLNVNEFAILVTNPQEFEKYLLLVKHYVLEDTNCTQCDIVGKDIFVTQVVGVAQGTDDLLGRADKALKEANRLNKNYLFYDDKIISSMEAEAQEIENMNRYKKALELNNIVPYFQPIVSAKTGEVFKYEALARLIDENGKVLSPYFFMDCAKKDRSSEFLARQLLQKVFNIYSLNPGLKVSVNLTYENISTDGLCAYIQNRLDKFGGKGITFEIIESEDIDDYANIEKFLELVTPYGCDISIDDFGSGYSNLAHLMKLNPAYLKLDGTLIQNIDTDDKSEQIVKSLLMYTKKTGSKVVAEFVSSSSIAKKAIDLGIDLLQGYHYGKPEPAEYYGLEV